MKAVLRQEPWQIVARDTPWNVGVGLTDKIRVAIAQCFQSTIDFTASAVGAHLVGKLVVIGFSDAHPRAIIHQDLELLAVVIGFACHHGMNAARIVTDHSSERAMIVRRRIWTEGEMIALRRIAEIVRCVICIRTGVWPERLTDVEEIDVVGEQLAQSEFVDEESRRAAIAGAHDIEAAAHARGAERT